MPERIDESYYPSPAHCQRCGVYVPLKLNGERMEHDCGRTAPAQGLPPNISVCPTCGGHAISRLGCWGSPEHPHDHVYMVSLYEFVRDANAATATPRTGAS